MADGDSREYHHHHAPPPPPQQHPVMHHDPYRGHYQHYEEQLPPPHMTQMAVHHEQPHGQRMTDDDQPLDLSIATRSPRDVSSDPSPPPQSGVKRARMEEPGSPGRNAGHGVCVVKGCGCQNALPLHHPHHAARLYRGRHSPYPSPQQYSPPQGHRSPGVTEAYPPYPPLHHQFHQSVSSPQLHGNSSFYSPESHDHSSRSPYGLPGVFVSSASTPSMPTYEGARSHSHSPSNTGLLCLPPHSTPTPLSVSPCPPGRELSPLMPAGMRAGKRPLDSHQISPRSRDPSPRPLYRPYEDVNRTAGETSSSSPVISSSNNGGLIPRQDPYRRTASDADASNSLLLLSSAPSTYSNVVTPVPVQGNLHRDWSNNSASSWEDKEIGRYGREVEPVQPRHYPIEEDRDERETRAPGTTTSVHVAPPPPPPSTYQLVPPHMQTALPPQHVSHAPPPPLHPAFSVPPPHHAYPEQGVKCRDADSTHERDNSTSKPASIREDAGRPSPPTVQQQQQQQQSPSDLVTSSSKSSRPQEETKAPRKPVMNVTNTRALAQPRADKLEKKEREQAEPRKNKLVAFSAAPSAASALSQDQSDGENTIDSSSSADSNSNDSTDSPDGALKSPDPNLKICLMDYEITRALLKYKDTPFKPCNEEMRRKLRTNSDKITFLDLIELHVEQRLKAC